MTVCQKNMMGVMMVIPIIMLVGGVIGSIYCIYGIYEHISMGMGSMGGREVFFLGIGQAISACAILIGGLTMLAIVYRKRYLWEGVKGKTFSRLISTILMPLMFVASFLAFIGVLGIVIMLILVFLYMFYYIFHYL